MKPKKAKSRTGDRHLSKLVRLSADLVNRLKALADQNDRPMSRELKRAVEAHLKREKM